MNIKDIPIGSVCIFDAVSGSMRVENRLGVRVEDAFGVEGVALRVWTDEDWNFTVKRVLAPSAGALARCAVIDPDDDEQVKALDLASGDGKLRDHLRALAALPVTKPDEPQGLGAVVLDPDTGQRWVRAGDIAFPWYSSAPVDWRCWDDFPATVQVLSEGLVA